MVISVQCHGSKLWALKRNFKERLTRLLRLTEEKLYNGAENNEKIRDQTNEGKKLVGRFNRGVIVWFGHIIMLSKKMAKKMFQ